VPIIHSTILPQFPVCQIVKANEIMESLTLENDTLSILKGVIAYKFVRIAQLPTPCTTVLDEKKAKDPLFNFEVFAETVKEHYAFFELNKIDWKKLYQQQKNKLSEKPTDARLYLAIEETLEKLNDNHGFLEAPEEVYEEVYEAVEKLSEPEIEEEEDKLSQYGDFGVAKAVATHHLQEEMTRDSWLIHWGKLNSQISYIQVKSM
jgi:carboxyl-terminal processing protease